ncbi:MAG: response regulator transcription factor [Bacteroidetes bacterium]|nr:response regulator transcription factor [Bacteroidota bacterium]
MSNPTILYVEDEPFLGRIVKESLEARNFTVTMVSDGKDAVKKFTDSRPDLCVLDVMLPNKDGYSIAQAIRQSNDKVPIIFVTAKTLTEDVVKGFEAGGNDYIRKPFSMEELILRINNLLRLTQRYGSPSEKIVLSEFEFHPDRYELRHQENVRKLSHREAMLLLVLSQNRNTTVSRKEVLLTVWGDDTFFNSRNLDVYISKLRDFFKPDPAIEIITIKGVGYRFSVDEQA